MKKLGLVLSVIFLVFSIPRIAVGLDFDYPVSENSYVPGSYDGRSFYYDDVHIGEDIELSEGTPIRAVADGKIVQYEYHTGYATSNDGTSIAAVIEHDLGVTVTFNLNVGHSKVVSTNKICSIYGHIRKSKTYSGTKLSWVVGDSIKKGEIIGYINDDNHNGDGNVHLHMGIRLSGHPGYWVYFGYQNISKYPQSNVQYFGAASEIIELLRCADIPQNYSLARIEGTDPVYWLQNAKAYHILSMEIINDMSGLPGWSHICDYPPDALEIIFTGPVQPDITFLQGPDFITTDPESNGLLIKLPDDTKVYLIEDGKRRWITTEAVFNNLGYHWDDVITVSQAIVALIPEGDPIEEQADFYLLSGTLTDAQGSSVPGWIYAYETSGANLGNRVYVAANEIYKMALFPGNYNVYADAYPDVTYGSTRIRTLLQNIDMTKDETLNFQIPSYDFYYLTGKVTDITGVELANVSVQAYNNSGVCYSSARTDSNGIYNISLIAGTYFLNFRPPNNSGFLDKRLDNIQINNDFTQDTFLVSSEQYKLSGTVTGISGIFDYITVYANEIGGTNYGSASLFDSAYEITLFPGTYRVVAYAYKYNYYDGNYIGYTSITAPYQTISILDDAELDIQVPSYDFYHLSGKVTDINDVIQPNVNIQAYDSTGVCQGYTTTNSNGNYDLLLSPGTYRLRITAPPATYPPFEIKRIVVSEDSTRNIRLSLEYTLLEEALALLAPNLDLALDVFDIIDQATSLNYDISVQGAKGLLQIILNWAGSEMKVALYNPDGAFYGEYQATEPPINIEIPNPTEGTWRCEVTAIDVPNDNYPFALVVGVTPNQLPVADANGPYSGVVDSPITFDAGNSYDQDGSISSYEWDWNNDGNYDESTDSATINHTWTESYSSNVALRVKDNEGATDIDIASVVVETTVIDTTPPEVEIKFPQSGTALQDGITLMAVASDAYGIAEVYFCVREPGGANGIPIGYEDLAGSLNSSGEWECDFDTTQLPDGYYVVIAKAIDTNDNEGWSEPVPCNIRNWAVIEFLPASKIYRAGRTMPIKFSLRIASSVDPTQPFVYNEGLEIRIYDASEPNTILLQTSLYGDTSTDYRIDTAGELYITNFKTSKTPAEYVVEIWRMSKNFLVGSFTFETVK
ncbi:MAG: carboxypeptidase regulatory-like domain-containing protein [Desulfobacterales bacterium]|nr:carboxypeptidase regulatory-like domain-containing protein [Desulfobacterales bacterium]